MKLDPELNGARRKFASAPQLMNGSSIAARKIAEQESARCLSCGRRFDVYSAKRSTLSRERLLAA